MSAPSLTRWFDAVILEFSAGRLTSFDRESWLAAKSRRDPVGRISGFQPGTRAYLSAGLPGAKWSVAGAAAARAEDADVELDEVERFCTEHDLWNHLE